MKPAPLSDALAMGGLESLVQAADRLAGCRDRGVTLVAGMRQERFISYDELFRRAAKALGLLRGLGLRPGRELVIQTADNAMLLTLFWACLLGGLVAVPLAPGGNPEQRRKLFHIWRRLRDPHLALDDKSLERLAQGFPGEIESLHGRLSLVEDLAAALEGAPSALDPARPGRDDLAFVQFSSGSTGDPKGVMLTHGNLLVNLRGLALAAQVGGGDVFLGWMPLTHDMGLIAFHLMPTLLGASQVIMDTGLFIRRPGLWLDKVHQHRATVLCAPNFGLQFFLANHRAQEPPSWDLSCVRLLFNAAEPISVQVCDRFLERLAPFGLPKSCMATCYGLAEATVAVAFPTPGTEFVRLAARPSSLAPGGLVEEAPPGTPGSLDLVEEGAPVEGCRVRVSHQGRDLGQGRVGHIQIKGPNVTQGFYRDPAAIAGVLDPEGWLDTGDLGFLRQGRVVVTGRAKDIIFAQGQNFYAQDIERVAEEVEGLGPGRVAAVGLSDQEQGQELVVLFVRHRSRDLETLAVLALALRERLSRQLGLAIHRVLPIDQLPKTTSGKLQRFWLRREFQEGRFHEAWERLEPLLERLATQAAPIGATPGGLPPGLEQVLAVWRRSLNQPQAGAETSLFALGGDSLAATRLAAALEQASGLRVQAADIFDHPTPLRLAAWLQESHRSLALPQPSPAAPAGGWPAGPAQTRIFALQTMDPQGKAYNLPLALALSGPVDASRLQEALRGLLARHEALRSGLELQDGRVWLRPLDPQDRAVREWRLETRDWPVGQDLGPMALGGLARAFDLGRPPLLRAVLLRQAPGQAVLFLDLHHAVVDGHSLPVLLADLAALYGGGAPVAPAPGLAQLAAAQVGGDRLACLEFWQGQLADGPPPLELPTDHERPPRRDFRGQVARARLDGGLMGELRRLAAAQETTPHLLLLAAFLVLLARHAGQEDLALGLASQGGDRRPPGAVGMLARTLVLRARPQGRKTFRRFLDEARQALTGALRHQDHTPEDLAPELGLASDPARNPLFDAMFAMEDMELEGLAWPGLAARLLEVDAGVAKFDLTLFARPEGRGMALSLEYASALFQRSRMEALLERYQILLRDLVQGGLERPLGRLQVLTAQEEDWLIRGFNQTRADYPLGRTLHALFQEQAARTPDKVAVVDADGPGGSLTYAQLNARANGLARRLRGLGLGPEVLAGVRARRSPRMVAAILAVLKAGGAYLPLEPDWPEERVRLLLEDAGAKVLLSDQPEPARPGLAVLDLNSPEMEQEDQQDPPEWARAHDLAYLIYTSGSTGRPKGVMVEHASAVNYLHWAQGVYLRGRALDCALFTSMAFDLTLTSFFLPLLNGNCLYLHGRADAALEVASLARDPRLGLLKLTPAHLALLEGQDLADSTVKVLIVGGEELKADLARRVVRDFAGQVELYNEYGPTEATVGCMIYRHDPGRDQGRAVPIGRPAANTALYVLDGEGRLAPPGAAGELYISGLGVARGYHRRPGLTARVFLPDPFRPGWRMYRSGDRARLLADGNLDYLGRLDHQVKLRGYRIEPEEIAWQLARHPGVAQAQVLLGQDGRGQDCLLAYFTSPGQPPSPAQLRDFLAALLPRYMLPSWFIPLKAWPLTANGKLDRAALPGPPEREAGQQAPEPAASPLESLMCRVWGQVLGRPGQEGPVGRQDNFFDLGGDSIKAMQIVSRLGAHGLRVAVADVLNRQSVAALALHCAEARGETGAPGGPLTGPKELSPMEGWFLALGLAEPGHFNQTIMLEARQGLDPQALERALAALVARHEGLRLNLDPASGRMFRNPAHLERPLVLARLAAGDPGLADQLAQARGAFDLERDLLLRAALIEGPGGSQRLLLCAHHLVVDAVSWGILSQDLAEALEGAPGPMVGGASPAAWLESLRTYYDQPRVQAELAFWAANQDPDFRLPLDHDPPDWRADRAAELSLGLDQKETGRLLTAARELRAELPTLLLTALAQALAQWRGRSSLVIECEGHGRLSTGPGPALEAWRAVGWFTAQYPLRLELSGQGPIATLALVKQRLADLPNHGLGYGFLRHCLARPELRDAPLLPEVRFNYLGDLEAGLGSRPWSWLPGESGLDSAPHNQLTCKLEVLAMQDGGALRLRLIYNQEAHDRATVERLGRAVLDHLRALSQPGGENADARLSPTDFATARLSARELDELFE